MMLTSPGPQPVALPGAWTAAAMIAAVVLSSTAGEVLTAAAMKSIGDLDDIRAHSGMKGAIRAVITSPLFFAGVGFLALRVGEDTAQEAIAVPIDGFGDAADVDHVAAEAEDHGVRRARFAVPAPARASFISARMRVIAAPSPPKMASPTRKWPMLSSTISDSAAMRSAVA